LEQTIWWKIVEQDKKTGNYKTLFHGINGSRTMQKDIWLKAVEKMVKDGTSKTSYLSGFHILRSKEECEEYLKYFKSEVNRVIVPCLAKGNIREKSHSRHPVFLSREIKFINEIPTDITYENVLLNIIRAKKHEIKLAERKRDKFKMRGANEFKYYEKVIETTEKFIEKKGIEIETIWICLIHFRSLIGVKNGTV